MKNKNKKQIIPQKINLGTFSGNIKRSTNRLKNASIKKYQNFYKINNIDFAKLINKYMPKKINKNNHNIGFLKYQTIFAKNNNNNCNNLNKGNTEKKQNSKKLKNTPKSDSYKRKLSCSYVKIRESAIKNLFHDNKPKANEDMNINTLPLPSKLSAKVIKENKQKFSFNIFDKNNNNKNILNKTKPFKKE